MNAQIAIEWMRRPIMSRPLDYFGSRQKMACAIHALILGGPSIWIDAFCGSAIVTPAIPPPTAPIRMAMTR